MTKESSAQRTVEEMAPRDIELTATNGTASNPQALENVAYSIYNSIQKAMITLLIGLGMLFSPMSANIYFPCLSALQLAVHTTRQLINLTITFYIVVQGIAPAFFGHSADVIGRRPVYLITFTVYVAASVGLALQTSYTALLVLRMLQSFGCSATVAIGYGVIADVVPPAQRGSMLGPAMVAKNLGPSLGPLIGGVLADLAGWRWVFWFLVTLGALFLLALLLVFPETGRPIVGNGSIEAEGWSKTLVSHLRSVHRGKKPLHSGCLPTRPERKLRVPNPFHSLRLILHKDAALVLSVSAIHYTV